VSERRAGTGGEEVEGGVVGTGATGIRERATSEKE